MQTLAYTYCRIEQQKRRIKRVLWIPTLLRDDATTFAIAKTM